MTPFAKTFTLTAPSRPRIDWRLQACATACLAIAGLFFTLGAHAQQTQQTSTDPSDTLPAAQPGAPAQVQGTPVPAAPAPTGVPVTPPAVATPRYSAAEVAQMFGYIDRNHDGMISREEASGFRGVARHFDEADTNKDGFLSRDEFEKAMAQVK